MMATPAKRTIRCILFDLGSTLWEHTDQLTWAALEIASNQKAVSILRSLPPSKVMPSLDDVMLGAALRDAVDHCIRRVYRDAPDVEPDYAQIALEGLHAIGIVQADLGMGCTIFEALRIRIPQSRLLFPDTLATLAILKARGYLLGVVTNRAYGGAPFQEDLQKMGLLTFFAPRHMAISADLGYRKPNALIFRHVLDGLEIQPENTAMVGDSLNADIWGAQQLGLFTIWKPKLARRAQAHALWTSQQASFSQCDTDAIVPGAFETEEAFLFAWMRQHDQQYDPRIAGMSPPDKIITSIADLLGLFD